MMGACCDYCGQTYETDRWGFFLCNRCVSAHLRFEEHARTQASWKRWQAVQAGLGAA